MFSPFFKSCVPSIALSMKRWMSKSYTVTAGMGSNMQKMLENRRKLRTWRTLQKISWQLNWQDKQGTHEQLSQNIKTVIDHSGNNTEYYRISSLSKSNSNSFMLTKKIESYFYRLFLECSIPTNY